jgi:hypothetical protein
MFQLSRQTTKHERTPAMHALREHRATVFLSRWSLKFFPRADFAHKTRTSRARKQDNMREIRAK